MGEPAKRALRDGLRSTLSASSYTDAGELTCLGPYEIEAEVGRGGMGVVYRASDRTTGRVVALKVLRPDPADGRARERFVREIRAAARVEHDNVVRVYSTSDPADPVLYFAMEYLAGASLAGRLRERARAARLARGGPGHRAGRRGARGRARGGPRPSRRQAGQHPVRPRDGQGQDRRLRAGAAGGRAVELDARRRGRRHARLPEPRAGPWRSGRRPAGRRLRAGGDALRMPRRRGPVPRRSAPGGSADLERRAAAAACAQRRRPARPGDGLPQGDGQGAASPLRLGGRDGATTWSAGSEASQCLRAPPDRPGGSGGSAAASRWRRPCSRPWPSFCSSRRSRS